MKEIYPIRKSLLGFWIVILISLLSLSTSSYSYSQPVMTSKEGFYFTLKANNFKPLEIAFAKSGSTSRWFDLFLNTFDANNLKLYVDDEFKWPQYSKSILNEMNTGIESCDFNKLYSFTCDAEIGKWDSNKSSFPIAKLYANKQIVQLFDGRIYQYMSYSASENLEYFDLSLKMDQSNAEALISSRKGNDGNINRKITAKVIYNVVNKSTQDINTVNNGYLRIYIHKIIFYNGSTSLGEIKPRIDFYDTVNLIKTNEIYPTIKDIDGNVYHTVKIGSQIWLVENLKTTKLNDGTNIYRATDYYGWSKLSQPAFCAYDKADMNIQTYGALYNWYAVGTGKLAPKGWHVATNEEWKILTDFIGGYNIAGRKLKEKGAMHWNRDNGTDESGFSALGGGRCTKDGGYGGVKADALWWTSSEISSDKAWARSLSDQGASLTSDVTFKGMFYENDNKRCGYSVRCVKNKEGYTEIGEIQQVNIEKDLTVETIKSSVSDVINGKGKLNYPDGSSYVGELKEGKREGKGKLVEKNGCAFEGEWKDNKRNGKGKFINDVGAYVEGYWKNDSIDEDSLVVKNYPLSLGEGSCIKLSGFFKNDELYNGIVTGIYSNGYRTEKTVKNGISSKLKRFKK